MVTVPFEYVEPLVPGAAYQARDRASHYWLRDGRDLMFCQTPVAGADLDSFRFYRGGFAKDRGACYCAGRRLRGADPASFVALNLSYAADHERVWTVGGECKGVHRPTFEVCDAGGIVDRYGVIALGYARDREHVYFVDYGHKPNLVRGADPAQFVAHGSEFGADGARVFWATRRLPTAAPGSWRRLGGLYSRDDAKFYYCNRRILDVDPATFEVVDVDGIQLAVDARHFYVNGVAVAEPEFDAAMRQKRQLRAAERALEP